MVADYFDDSELSESAIPLDGAAAEVETHAVLRRILFGDSEVWLAHSDVDAQIALQLIG